MKKNLFIENIKIRNVMNFGGKYYEYENRIELEFVCLSVNRFIENLYNLYIKFVMKNKGICVICMKI